VFSTLAEGLKARRAQEWGLIDGHFPTSKFDEGMAAHVRALADGDGRKETGPGIRLNSLEVEETTDGRVYKYVSVKLNREGRYADLTVRGPEADLPTNWATRTGRSAPIENWTTRCCT